jgi:taurine dioxygenase
MQVTSTGASFGARIGGLDLSRPLSDIDREQIIEALGTHGVVSFPLQHLDAASLKQFAGAFGTLEVNVANSFQEPGHPEVMVLSNIVENGKPLGLADAGQDWHTDMSYSHTLAFANVLYAVKIPTRNGTPLGCTEFSNMHKSYEDLPNDLKKSLDGRTATHDFNKFWEKMRSVPGSKRPPLTEEQRRRKPPVSHPIFMRHPITKKTVLYANPGYTMKIDDMDAEESDRILAFLFEHQLQEKYRHKHTWSVNDVLMWDNLGTLHNAVADYGPDEHRLIKRCQVMADFVFARDTPG